ncbi:glycosyltransferase family 4 protein [bacterium]|nr:glycosyltransferase family 4 protein [bacterium]
MKILNVCVNMNIETGGGATERARQLSLHLLKKGHEVTVLTTDYCLSSNDILSLEGARFIILPCLNSRFFMPLPLFGKVSRGVKESDVVHLVSHWTLINAMTFMFVKLHKKPYVVNPLGALPIFGRSSLLKRAYNFLIGRKIIQEASSCVVATMSELAAFRSYGVDESRIIHIPNGIDEKHYTEKSCKVFRTRIGLDQHPFILFIGRLNPIKGPDILLEAFCKLREGSVSGSQDLHLVYIGPDEGVLDSLREVAADNTVLDKIHFLGYVEPEDKSRLIDACSFLVVPSRQEAMSIVVLEAGIAGKPVVMTDQCGFDEIEEIGGGHVVSASVDGLTRGIERMLVDKDNYKCKGAYLQKFVKDQFLWDSIVMKYIALFKQLAVLR